jgi:hypothetical protein
MIDVDSLGNLASSFLCDPLPEYSDEDKAMRDRLQGDIKAYLEAGNTIEQVDSTKMKKIRGSDKLTYRDWNHIHSNF